jgi:penicillin amidase
MTPPPSGHRRPSRRLIRRFLRILDALYPAPVPRDARLGAFPTDDLPLERPATIRWNPNQVPFVEAATDRDLAFILGMIHGHLRGGQVALFKRFFHGRLAEVLGPLAAGLDHAIRILDYGHAADAIARQWSAETLAWVTAFVDGINAYHDRCPRLPPEYDLFAVEPEPFTLHDILVGARFGATDFTWLTYLSMIGQRGRPSFARLWNRTLDAGESPTPGFRPDDPQGVLEDLMLGSGRAGSNSFAVSPHRSATGGALIANDPHLGLSLPNLWLIVGVRSPSFHLAGLMIPGLPVFPIGRNPDMAWGGTNMRAASSDLYDVSRLPPDQIETEVTRIKCRFWRTRTRPVRRTPFGPIITDASSLKLDKDKPIAIRWVGQEATDEFTAFLKAARARDPDEFRAAFATYGVSGQNMLFADRAGNIGQVMAVRQPIRSGFAKDDPVLDPADPETHWRRFATALDLPFKVNPPSGVLASANDRPVGTNVPIGFTFGSDDRIRRLYQLLNVKVRLGIDDLVRIQRDTHAPDAATLAEALVARIRDELGPGAQDSALLRRLADWNGDYGDRSSGAVAFECLMYHLVPPLYGGRSAQDLPDLLSQWTYLTTYLLADLASLPAARRREVCRRALARAEKDAARYPRWGKMHRLRIAHMLARLPLVGRRFVAGDIEVGGSRQTPLKMAHGLVARRHHATFGQMARHISDLSDVDANWFVLLGGQDGWFGSENYVDQVALWRQGRYVRVPLRKETVAAEFPTLMTLKPRPPKS